MLPGGDIVVGDGASAALLVMRACGGGAACSCRADADCGHGYSCASGLCKQKWALALGGGASMGIASTPDLFPGNDFTLEMWVKFSSGSAGTIWSKWTDSLEDKHFHRFSPGLLGYISFTAVGSYLLVQFIDRRPSSGITSRSPTMERPNGSSRTERSSEAFPRRRSTSETARERSISGATVIVPTTSPARSPSPTSGSPVALATPGPSVPQAEFTNDVMTRALWHLDAGTGATVPDSSGHGHTATLSGPYGWVADDR